ncbi:tetratricopeptide repeat protein [Streptomyces adustus]|uniref:tetratricopeptide repeat protein n=1 Tax=Streptomyces adustus TaxID=1609272 RepID=UPI003723C5FA
MVLILGAATGWSHSVIGAPTWTSWVVAALAILIGWPLAWFSTKPGIRSATNLLLNAYRRDGLEYVEQHHLSRLGPYRAGIQLFNLALALDRAGDRDGALEVYRRAADRGSPPAMVNLAYWLSQHGEHDEAQEWYRRATEAGYKRVPPRAGER